MANPVQNPINYNVDPQFQGLRDELRAFVDAKAPLLGIQRRVEIVFKNMGPGILYALPYDSLYLNASQLPQTINIETINELKFSLAVGLGRIKNKSRIKLIEMFQSSRWFVPLIASAIALRILITPYAEKVALMIVLTSICIAHLVVLSYLLPFLERKLMQSDLNMAAAVCSPEERRAGINRINRIMQEQRERYERMPVAQRAPQRHWIVRFLNPFGSLEIPEMTNLIANYGV